MGEGDGKPQRSFVCGYPIGSWHSSRIVWLIRSCRTACFYSLCSWMRTSWFDTLWFEGVMAGTVKKVFSGMWCCVVWQEVPPNFYQAAWRHLTITCLFFMCVIPVVWYSISMAIYVRGTYRQTQLFYWLIIVKFYNNMFRPYSRAIIRLYHNLE